MNYGVTISFPTTIFFDPLFGEMTKNKNRQKPPKKQTKKTDQKRQKRTFVKPPR